MFRTAVSALALIAALGACAPNPNTAPLNKQAAAESQEAISAKLNAWFDTRYEEQLQFSPIQLTFLGRKDKNDQIDCFTHACADEQLAWLKTATDELKATMTACRRPTRIPMISGSTSMSAPQTASLTAATASSSTR
jgi:hypothetical protein